MNRITATIIDLVALAIAGVALWSDEIKALLPGNLLSIIAAIVIFSSLWRLWHRYRRPR